MFPDHQHYLYSVWLKTKEAKINANKCKIMKSWNILQDENLSKFKLKSIKKNITFQKKRTLQKAILTGMFFLNLKFEKI